MTTLASPTPLPLHNHFGADLEPDEAWKNVFRVKIEDSLSFMVEDAKKDYQTELAKGLTSRVFRVVNQKYEETMNIIRTCAQDIFVAELERERERRWAVEVDKVHDWHGGPRSRPAVHHKQNRESREGTQSPIVTTHFMAEQPLDNQPAVELTSSPSSYSSSFSAQNYVKPQHLVKERRKRYLDHTTQSLKRSPDSPATPGQQRRQEGKTHVSEHKDQVEWQQRKSAEQNERLREKEEEEAKERHEKQIQLLKGMLLISRRYLNNRQSDYSSNAIASIPISARQHLLHKPDETDIWKSRSTGLPPLRYDIRRELEYSDEYEQVRYESQDTEQSPERRREYKIWLPKSVTPNPVPPRRKAHPMRAPTASRTDMNHDTPDHSLQSGGDQTSITAPAPKPASSPPDFYGMLKRAVKRDAHQVILAVLQRPAFAQAAIGLCNTAKAFPGTPADRARFLGTIGWRFADQADFPVLADQKGLHDALSAVLPCLDRQVADDSGDVKAFFAFADAIVAIEAGRREAHHKEVEEARRRRVQDNDVEMLDTPVLRSTKHRANVSLALKLDLVARRLDTLTLTLASSQADLGGKPKDKKVKVHPSLTNYKPGSDGVTTLLGQVDLALDAVSLSEDGDAIPRDTLQKYRDAVDLAAQQQLYALDISLQTYKSISEHLAQLDKALGPSDVDQTGSLLHALQVSFSVRLSLCILVCKPPYFDQKSSHDDTDVEFQDSSG
ncbi:hypothetical protein C0992_009494 [Termitomyces sp. T32_za158]|nr:hypothetical protein C0992_009494 [Termitomyces sp. T32_za158]